MKQFFRTVTGKSILFVVCVIAVCLTFASAVSAAWMLGGRFYTRTEKEIFDRVIYDEMHQEVLRYVESYAREIAHPKGNRPHIIHDHKNLIFEVVEKGKILVKTEATAPSNQWLYQFQLMHNSEIENNPQANSSNYPSYVLHVIDSDETPQRIIRVAFVEGFPHSDIFSLRHTVVKTLYGLRYGIYAFIFLFGMIGLASFIALMTVAGRRKGSEELHLGPLNKVPFDLLVCISYGFIIFWFFTFARTIHHDTFGWLILAVLGVLITVVTLGICLSGAVRCKQGTFLKNNLITLVPLWIWRGITNVFKLLHRSFRSFQVANRVMLIVLLVLIADAFLNAVFINSSALLILWIAERIFLLLLAAQMALSLHRIRKGGAALASGNLGYQTNTTGLFPGFIDHAEDLNRIAKGMAIAVEERLKSERMKTELITNVSHDIKTPLTSIINYSNLVYDASTTDQPDITQIREYSDVLKRQSGKLKNLMEDLIEASNASTGNIDLTLTPADAALYLSQISGEYADRLEKAGLTPVIQEGIPENEYTIMADSRRMWRVFDNVLNNICKYSLAGTRVYLGIEARGKEVVFYFKNTSKDPLNMEPSELFERFTRGDQSRNTEGSGLGLSIAKSLVELQGGKMEISIDGDLFKVMILFPIVS